MTRIRYGVAMPIAAAVLSVLFVPHLGGSASAQATVDDVASEIVEEALDNLGVSTEPSEILDEVASEVADVLDDDVIDDDIVDTVTDAIENGEEIEDELDEALDDNLDEAETELDETAPLWREAYESVKSEFVACREAADNASDCAAGLGFRLQVAQSTAILADIDARLAAIALLPADEQEAALAELEQMRERVTARLERAQSKLASGAPGSGSEKAAEQARKNAERLAEKKKEIADRRGRPTTTSVPSGGQSPDDSQVDESSPGGSGKDKGDNGKDKGNNGKGGD